MMENHLTIYQSVITEIKCIISSGQEAAYSASSKAMLSTYWNIGKQIVEQELGGSASYWDTKGEYIRRAVKVGFPKNTDAILTLETKLSKLKGLSLSKDTIFQDGELICTLEIDGFMKSDFDVDKKAIKEKEKNMKDLSAEIELLSKNNKMLKLLSSLSANKQVVIEYRDAVVKENGVARCPVCGSKSFSTMEEVLILKEADEYIKQNGEVVKEKEVDKNLLQTEIETLYQKIINSTKTVVEKEKETLETEINDLKVLKDEIQPYFDEVKVLQKSRQAINLEELTAEKVEELLATVDEVLLDKGKERKIRDNYQQILTVLGYEFENETVQQTYAKVKNLITR